MPMRILKLIPLLALAAVACAEAPVTAPLGSDRLALAEKKDGGESAQSAQGVNFDFNPVEQKFFWAAWRAPEGDIRACDVYYQIPEARNLGHVQNFQDGSKHLRISGAPINTVRILANGAWHITPPEQAGVWSASMWFNAGNKIISGNFTWSGSVVPEVSKGVPVEGATPRPAECRMVITGGTWISNANIAVF